MAGFYVHHPYRTFATQIQNILDALSTLFHILPSPPPPTPLPSGSLFLPNADA